MSAPPSPPETLDELKRRLQAALADRRHDVAAGLLIDAALRMLATPGWQADRWRELAALLQDNQQFGYARRLYRRVYEGADASAALKAEIRTGYSLTIYK